MDTWSFLVGRSTATVKTADAWIYRLTFTFSPSISICLSRKSTPMVASTLVGNCPSLSRWVRQVFPTPESPISSTLNVRQRVISEDTLPRELENSSDDSIYTRGSKQTNHSLAADSKCYAKIFLLKIWFCFSAYLLTANFAQRAPASAREEGAFHLTTCWCRRVDSTASCRLNGRASHWSVDAHEPWRSQLNRPSRVFIQRHAEKDKTQVVCRNNDWQLSLYGPSSSHLKPLLSLMQH